MQAKSESVFLYIVTIWKEQRFRIDKLLLFVSNKKKGGTSQAYCSQKTKSTTRLIF